MSGEPASAEEEDRGERRAGERVRGAHAYYLYGIVRGRNFRGTRSTGELADLHRVRYRDLEALARHAEFAVPEADDASVQAHQRIVDTVMRRATVLPAPFGLVFRGRRALIHFMEDQYLALDEALAFVDGHWEVRLHVAAERDEKGAALSELATHVYTELRRFARAAIPFPSDERRLLSAAFLVERSQWIEFVERTDDVAGAHPELNFDVTGPWPPYDFIRMTL